jgi:hypothetical protein
MMASALFRTFPHFSALLPQYCGTTFPHFRTAPLMGCGVRCGGWFIGCGRAKGLRTAAVEVRR